jgi:tRNA modification GTPase
MTAAGRSTIYALSSAPGRAGVAVVRVSGPQAGVAVRALTGRPLPRPRVLTLAALRWPAESSGYGCAAESSPADESVSDCGYRAAESDAELIDRACVVWMPGPASFTGEDVAEFHVHGGRAVVAAVLDAVGALAGTEPAEAGAFTRRAFEAGKMDLTAAEGLIDLIDAETEAQRRQGLRQMEGALGALYDGWRTRLVSALALVTADIDFSDEDLPDGLWDDARVALSGVIAEMADHLADARRGERLRDGLRVAVLGRPNVGKSTLLNALAGREAAIVSPIAGTTRDVIEVHLDIGGYPVTLADMAGLRMTEDPIEREGVRRAEAWAASADLRLLVLDAAADAGAPLPPDAPAAEIVVFNKADEAGAPPAGLNGLWVSALTGDGVGAVVDAIRIRLESLYIERGAPLITRERYRFAVESAKQALERAVAGDAVELIAEDVRAAAQALGRITGRIDVEDVLDAVFRDFCIGK